MICSLNIISILFEGHSKVSYASSSFYSRLKQKQTKLCEFMF